VPVTVHPDSDHDGDVEDPAALTDFLGEGVHPHIRVGARVEGPVPELGDHLIEFASHTRHLGLGQRLDPQGLHQPVDAPGAHTPDVALGHHRHEGLFRSPPRVDEPVRKVAAPPQLRDRQIDAADPRVEGPLTVAVAVVHPLRRHLAPASTGQRVDLGGHKPLRELAHHLLQKIIPIALELLAQPPQRVHLVVDHRVLPLVVSPRTSKRLTRWSSRPGDLRPLHHYLGLN
jgi:hypothetical protein